MPVHLRKHPQFWLVLFALCLLDFQQKPWGESRQITAEQWEERGNILGPITQGVVPGKRDKWDVSHAPEMEGKPAADYQRLLDFADYVRHDPVNHKDTYFYATFFDSRSPVGIENVWHYSFIIIVREKRIEYAELPPPMD